MITMESELIPQLKRHNEELFQLISSSTQSYLLARVLADKDEKKYEISLDFILYHEYLYIKNTILDLYKILNKKKDERFNIYKYIERIQLELKHFKQLTQNDIDSWRSKLASHDELIDHITNLRSKYYAHIDKDYEKYTQIADSEILFEKLENLFSDLQDIYIEANLLFYNDPRGFSSPISVEYFNEILSRHLKK